MGEAKRKREAAARHGADAAGRRLVRGLVVSPPIEVNGTTLNMRSSNLDPQELRCATLLWDKIVWPSSQNFYLASGPDEQFLEQVGFLSRPDYTVDGNVARGIALGQIAAFEDLDKKEPDVWSLAQGENSFLLRSGFLIEAGNAQLKLTNAIPVPNRDVPLAEVLEFKARRNDELQLLRSGIDDLVKHLEASEDAESEMEALVSKVDNACADAIRVGSEWQFPVRLINHQTSYKLRPFEILGRGLVGALAPQSLGLSSSYEILAGLAGAALAIAPAMELTFDGFGWRGLRPSPQPFRYVYSFNRELF